MKDSSPLLDDKKSTIPIKDYTTGLFQVLSDKLRNPARAHDGCAVGRFENGRAGRSSSSGSTCAG